MFQFNFISFLENEFTTNNLQRNKMTIIVIYMKNKAKPCCDDPTEGLTVSETFASVNKTCVSRL